MALRKSPKLKEGVCEFISVLIWAYSMSHVFHKVYCSLLVKAKNILVEITENVCLTQQATYHLMTT